MAVPKPADRPLDPAPTNIQRQINQPVVAFSPERDATAVIHDRLLVPKHGDN
jgi:hypothetical protein